MFDQLKNRVMQRHDKDCLQACLSSLLGIEYDEIPKFYENYGSHDDHSWMDEYSTWLLKNFKLIPLQFNVTIRNDIMILPMAPMYPYYCIGRLQKTNEKYSHAVVIKVNKNTVGIVWDPLVSSAYTIDDLIEIEILVNPANQY